jgi:DNA polymerase-3 subunit gamma/tau
MEQFRNLVVSLVAPQDRMFDLSESEQEEVRSLAQRVGLEKLQVLLNLMINREVDLRFTSHPRLILETIMIRLCHIGDLFSFSDLLERIESLEKRLVATLANDQSPNTIHLFNSDAPGVLESQHEAQNSWKKGDEGSPTWEEFLKFLLSKSKAMYNILKDWHLQKLTETTVEIARSNQSFSSAYFDDPERYEQLSNYCRDFFRRNITVRIVSNCRSSSKTKAKLSEKQPEPIVKNQTNLSPSVQDILHMFQGRVIERYPAKEAGFENRNDLKEE